MSAQPQVVPELIASPEPDERLEDDLMVALQRFGLRPSRRGGRRGKGVLRDDGPDGVGLRTFALLWTAAQARSLVYSREDLDGLKLALEDMSCEDVARWVKGFHATRLGLMR